MVDKPPQGSLGTGSIQPSPALPGIEVDSNLFKSMPQGCAFHQVVLSDDGLPCNYIFLDTNPAFERLTGLKRADTIGRLVTQVIPNIEPFWIDTYGKVALGGQPVEFDHYIQALDRYYRVYAYSPAPGYFVTIFTDVSGFKQIELQLHEVAEKYFTLFNSTSDGVWINNLDGEILEVNDAYCHMSGYSREELIHMHISQIEASENRYEIAAHIRKVIEGSGHDRFESVHRRKDGSVFSVDITALYFDREAGRMAIFVRDNTAHKQVEQRLTYLASFPECNPNPITEADMQGRLHYANPTALSLFPDMMERSPNHPWFAGWEDAVRPFHQGKLDLILRDVTVGDRTYQQSISYMVSTDLVRIYGIDITRRQQMEETIRLSEEKYRTMVETAAEGIVQASPGGTYLYANQQMANMLGYTLDEIIGKSSLDFMFEPQEASVRQLRQDLKRGDTLHGEFKFRRKDGSVLWTMYNASPIFNHQGVHVANLAMHTDITYRKLSEEALRQSEKRLSRSQEIAHLGSWELDLTTDHLTWSDEVYRLFGYEPNEFPATYSAFLDAVHPDDRAAVDEAYTSSIRDGRDIYEIDHRLVNHRTGEVRIVHEKCMHFRDASGRVIRSEGMVHDITERKKAEEELRRARDELEMQVERRTIELKHAITRLHAERQRYHDLFDFSPDGYLVTDINGQILESNHMAAEMFQVTNHTLIGRSLLEYIDPTEHTAFSKVLEVFTHRRDVQSMQLKLVAHNSAAFISAVTIACATDERGTDTLRWTLRDITEQKQAEETIRQNSLRNAVLSEISQSLAEASLDEKAILDVVAKTTARLVGDACVITLASEDGIWLQPAAWSHKNNSTFELLNNMYASSRHPATEGSSGRVYQTSRPVLVEKVDAPFDPSVVSQTYRQYIEEIGVSSLLIVPISIGNRTIGTLGLSRDHFGESYTLEDMNLLEVLADRTAQAIHNARLYRELQNALRKELEMHGQLVQSEKFAAVGRLLASITHEINNPLQTIRNCLYLSQQETLADSPVAEYLTMASNETDRLSNLVAQLREIYRPSTKDQFKPVSLPSLLAEVQTLLAGYLQEKHVSWSVTPAGGNPFAGVTILAAPEQLKQVFLNIALNAIDAMEPGGGSILIDLKPSSDGSMAGICFRDTGPGLPDEVKARLFEPFTTTKEKGLGLGLVICYDIIKKHNGSLEVESEPGKGAAFTIWLPAGHAALEE